jgi:hypothetical protein
MIKRLVVELQLYHPFCLSHMYSLRLEILVGEMDVSRHILVLDTFIFIHLYNEYFRTEGVDSTTSSAMPFIFVLPLFSMLINLR